jgi:hypothetical protein
VSEWTKLSAMAADARLGRMIRKLSNGLSLEKAQNSWFVLDGYCVASDGDTPEEAFEKAGIK